MPNVRVSNLDTLDASIPLEIESSLLITLTKKNLDVERDLYALVQKRLFDERQEN